MGEESSEDCVIGAKKMEGCEWQWVRARVCFGARGEGFPNLMAFKTVVVVHFMDWGIGLVWVLRDRVSLVLISCHLQCHTHLFL